MVAHRCKLPIFPLNLSDPELRGQRPESKKGIPTLELPRSGTQSPNYSPRQVGCPNAQIPHEVPQISHEVPLFSLEYPCIILKHLIPTYWPQYPHVFNPHNSPPAQPHRRGHPKPSSQAAPHAFQSSDGSATLRPIRRRKVWQLGVLQHFADFGGSSKTLDRIPDAAIHNPAPTLLCP